MSFIFSDSAEIYFNHILLRRVCTDNLKMNNVWSSVIKDITTRPKKVHRSVKAILSYILTNYGETYETLDVIPTKTQIRAYLDILNEPYGGHRASLLFQLELIADPQLLAQVALDHYHLRQRLEHQIHFIKQHDKNNHLIDASLIAINITGGKPTIINAALLDQQFRTNRKFLNRVSL